MELDILNKENLDSSITNEKSSGFDAINTPIKRGMYVCPKAVMSPYYEYEYSNLSGTRLVNKTNLMPRPKIGSTAIPIPVSSPNVSTGIHTSLSPIGSLNPNFNTGLFSSPVSNVPPVTMMPSLGSGLHNQLETPVTPNEPFTPMNPLLGGGLLGGGLNNIPTQSYTSTPLVTPILNTPTENTQTSNIPLNDIPSVGGAFGGGGGGGVSAPASEESNTEQTPVASAMKTADVTKKGLSKEVKIGLLVLVAIGGYYAYKKGLLSKI